ncbi:MAG: sensor histidine kinase [Arenicella sp.]
MGAYWRQLTLVKRYLWGSLLAAILPLVVISYLYDSHNTSLSNKLINEKFEGEIQSTVVKINSFINVQAKRLNDIDDLQGIDVLFLNSVERNIPDQLLDFLYFQTSDADVYSVEFYDVYGDFLWSLPKVNKHPAPILSAGTLVNDVTVSEPVLPSSGRPGWFYMYKPVVRKGKAIGIIALKIRLTSLTELTASLYQADAYEPVISIPQSKTLNALGVMSDSEGIVLNSHTFIPGWSIGLKQSGQRVSKTGIRDWLLVSVIISSLCVVLLFFSMSRRLANFVTPLIAGARSIAKGNFGVRVVDDIPGELGILARSFNNMSTQLSAMVSSRVDMERRAALGNLATGIAHEIRNPLATIGTTVHGLIASEKDPERKAMLEAVDNEIIRTDAIVEEFMNYARPREPKMERVAIGEIFNHVKVLVSATALETGVDIILLGQRSVHVFADPGQLRQILMNIILNAIQAMPKGGHLSLKAVQNQGWAEITVSDTGAGIDAEELQHVKQPFYTTKKGGTGLGLAICVQLVNVNHGTFHIDSELGEGTQVLIKFPMVQKNELKKVL